MIFTRLTVNLGCGMVKGEKRNRFETRFFKSKFIMLGNGAIALGDSLALLPWHLKLTSMSRVFFKERGLLSLKGPVR